MLGGGAGATAPGLGTLVVVEATAGCASGVSGEPNSVPHSVVAGDDESAKATEGERSCERQSRDKHVLFALAGELVVGGSQGGGQCRVRLAKVSRFFKFKFDFCLRIRSRCV